MQIKNLKNTSLEQIVECLLVAFDGYFVKMPSDLNYWRKRFQAARVDYSLSFGVFDEDKLVAFIMQGIDQHKGNKAAFNTGTGVVPDYRGKKLVDSIYEYTIPILKENGIKKCMLEVIQENELAIRVYKRIGFDIIRSLRCYKGELELANINTNVQIEEVDFSAVSHLKMNKDLAYSWDHVDEAVIAAGNMYKTYLVNDQDKVLLGYFIINPDNGYLVQIEITNGAYTDILKGITQLCKTIKINNIDPKRETLIHALESTGLENHIRQYEMEVKI